jgi:hypothetical protein
MSGKAIHVVMTQRKWAVMRYGDLTPLSMHDRKADAVVEARAIANEDRVEVVVFDLGGRPIAEDQAE